MVSLHRRGFLAGFGGVAATSLIGATPFSAAALNDTMTAPSPLLLNYNENALGMSPKASAAAAQAVAGAFRYPDALAADLLDLLAAGNGLATENIILGAGSNQNLKMAVDATLSSGNGLLVTAEPSFGSPEEYAAAQGATIARVPLDDKFRLDVAAMRRAAESHDGPVLVYICNPNNPTATVVDSGEIFGWIRSAPDNLFFLVDEAYHEFVTAPEYESAVSLVKDGQPNLTVARTFSKVFGMAGLRIGYSMATTGTSARLRPFISFDNVNAAGLAAASASLRDEAWIRYSLAKTAEAKHTLYEALEELGLEYVPSQANFVLHRITGDLAEYQRHMKQHNVHVGRAFARTQGWNRLSLGTPDEMTTFARILKEFRAKGWV